MIKMNAASEITIHETTTCPEGMTEVHVYAELGEIPDGMPWFTAVKLGKLRFEVTYFVPMDDEGLASWRHVEQIEKLHPGCSLVYL